jgi:hypothetical protein
MIQLERDIKLDIISGKYKCISAYKIPKDIDKWLDCTNCGLKPLTWEFNNGRSTGCGCGENEYDHFSIWAESIMSHVGRNKGSALEYDSHELRKNWNHWVETGEELVTRKKLLEDGKW